MLDASSRRQVMATIHQLHRREGLTVLLITQSMDEAATAQRVLLMGNGLLAMDGRPQDILSGHSLSAGRSSPAGCTLSAGCTATIEQIQALGLELPTAARMALELRYTGFDLPLDVLSIERLASAIDEWASTSGRSPLPENGAPSAC
jgi:energy-coupling factor transport system ATP-binding protein